MRPRVVYRTHYQVDEPFFMELLVKQCTSAVQSAYTERVTSCLSAAVKTRYKGFNIPAAGYAVDLARGLHLITENNVWTERGHLLALCAAVGAARLEDQCELDSSERLAHFRVFVEEDGAAFLYIARMARKADQLPENGDWNAFAQNMFTQIYSEYLKAAGDISERVGIRREIDRLKHPFNGKTGHHKSYVHLQTLVRLGLLERHDVGGQRHYLVHESARHAFEELLRLIPNAMALETMADKGTWADVAAAVFNLGHGEPPKEGEVLDLVMQAYRAVSETGVSLCALETLMDAVQVRLLAAGAGFVGRARLLELLADAQRRNPRDVRFHVDRRGRPAFLKLSANTALQS